MIKRKQWAKYTADEIETMRDSVANAPDEQPFPPEYAAAYLGVSSSTLQHMRCHKTDGIVFSKIGGHVRYRKKHLDEYLTRCEQVSTA